MQAASPLHLFQLALQLDDPIADQTAVHFELALAGTAQEAEAAALTLEVGPGPHQAGALVAEMGKLDL